MVLTLLFLVTADLQIKLFFKRTNYNYFFLSICKKDVPPEILDCPEKWLDKRCNYIVV